MTEAREILRQMRNLEFAGFDDLAPGTSLVIAPHADDETLGCGGLIATACANGRPPFIVVVSDGVQSHPHSAAFPPPVLKAVREAELKDAISILGVPTGRAQFLELPDSAIPSDGPVFDEAVLKLVDLVNREQIQTVFVTWPHDPHCDHLSCARMAEAVALTTGISLRYYPVWGWLLPGPMVLPAMTVAGHRLEIASYMAAKRRAVAAHESQYSDLISDDPTGFRLPSQLLAVFDRPYEVFLLP